MMEASGVCVCGARRVIYISMLVLCAFGVIKCGPVCYIQSTCTRRRMYSIV